MLLKATFLRAINEALFFVQPAVLGCLVFTAYHLLGNVLTPQKVRPWDLPRTSLTGCLGDIPGRARCRSM